MIRLQRSRRGFSAIYVVIALVALCGVVSLAVDWGRVQLAKTQLQTAADAAARAAAGGLTTSSSQARSDAANIASANLCDGTPVVLDTTADIEFGSWDPQTRTFTTAPGGSQDSATSIRITARRWASRGTAVPLLFASIIGRSTCDIHAVAIVTLSASSPSGFTGLNGITLKNNGFFGSYNSGSNPNPTQASANTHGVARSNGVITVGNNATVKGDVQLGPAGSLSGSPLVSGATTHLGSAIDPPTSPAWSPSPNPGGIPQNYTVSQSTTLPGGTYWFTSLTSTGSLSFSGPAVVYVNGNVALSGGLTAADRIPANLRIYQLGSSRTFGDGSSNAVSVVADIEAPGADFSAKNNATIYGRATFRTITVTNNASFFYDEAGGPAGGSRTIALVQ